MNFLTVSGVTATRVSPGSVSLGVPIRMTFPCNSDKVRRAPATPLQTAGSALEDDGREAEQDEQRGRKAPAEAGHAAKRAGRNIENETDEGDERMPLQTPQHQQQNDVEDVDGQVFGQADETGVGLLVRRQIDAEIPFRR